MKIFLIGYMGSGKTTIGKKLSNYLNYKFLDLDKYLENYYKSTIEEIFAVEGEDGFRKKEQKILDEVIKLHEDLVISTGGGTPCFFDNMEKINLAGTSLYFKVGVEVLVNRLKNAKTQRPIIANKDEDELFSFISGHLAQRASYYEKAKLIVNASNFGSKELKDLAEKIGLF